MAPTYQAVGTAIASTGASVNVAWPTHLTNDIGLVVIETSGNSATLTPPTGWVAIPGTPVTDVATTAGSKLHVWWKRAASNAESSVATGAATDHIVARLYTFRGCITTGNPWNVTTTGTKTTASTTATVPALVTTLDDTLITMIVGRPDDNSSPTHFGVPVNSNLTGLAEATETGTTNGNGGGFVVSYGVKSTPGDTGTSTLTKSASTTDTYVVLALKATTELIGTTATYTTADTTTRLQFQGTLIQQTGTFTVAGVNTILLNNRLLDLSTQAFTVTGIDSSLDRSYSLSTSVGPFSIIGIDTNLQRALLLTNDSGLFTVTGIDASLAFNYGLNGIAGPFAIVGNSADLNLQQVLSLTTGSFALAGTDVALQKSKIVQLLTESFTVNGTNLGFNLNSIFYLTPATFTTRLQSNGDFFWYRTTQTIQPAKYRLTNRNQWILGRATHMGRRGL